LGTKDLDETADADGNAWFTYTGGPNAGTDAILACLDLDKDPTDTTGPDEIDECFRQNPDQDRRRVVCKTWVANWENEGGRQGTDTTSKNYSFGGMWAAGVDPGGSDCIANKTIVNHGKRGTTVACHFDECTFNFSACTASNNSNKIGRPCNQNSDCNKLDPADTDGVCTLQTPFVFTCGNTGLPEAPCGSAPPPNSTADHARVQLIGTCNDTSTPRINLHTKDAGEPGTNDRWGFNCGNLQADTPPGVCGGIGPKGGGGYFGSAGPPTGQPNKLDNGNVQIHTIVLPPAP
jgi:hypothetical protein